MNALSINIPANFIFSCENTLARYAAATSEGVKRAILDRQTLQGIKWAIDFCKSLDTDYMTEAQLVCDGLWNVWANVLSNQERPQCYGKIYGCINYIIHCFFPPVDYAGSFNVCPA